eukprot:Filipodium_phascolosomae@DN2257_c0_g1_i2.p1
MWGKPTSKGTALEKAIAGGIAVTPEVATITTLELAKIGLQLDAEKKYGNSMTKLIKDVYSKKGPAGCMIGWQGVQARQMLWTSAYFASLDGFKGLFAPISSSPPVVNFLSGFAAGVLGAICNTPADVIRTNIQKQGLSETCTESSLYMAVSPMKMVSLGQSIASSKGPQALFSGLLIKSCHLGGSGAFVAMLIPLFSSLFGVKKSIM